MPRDVTIKAFKFEELDDRAKERARDWFRGTEPWGWQSEWWASAQAFGSIAPISIERADYDRREVQIEWRGDDDVCELTGLRAWKWLQNNGWFTWAREESKGSCTMTGFCGDAPFGDPIADYYHKPLHVPDLKQVFYECAQAWVQEAANDAEHAYSDEGVDEAIEANDYEFTEDGNLFA